MNTALFEELREAKKRDLHAMEEYIYTEMPRMKYLCSFLDSDEHAECSNCDNTDLKKIVVEETAEYKAKLENFRDTYFPTLEMSSFTTRKGGVRVCFTSPNTVKIETTVKDEFGEVVDRPIIEHTACVDRSIYTAEEVEIIKEHLAKASRLVDGYAASYYGVSNIGATIHRCKYENGGDFPDFLLKKTLSVFGKKFRGIHFDLLLYIPPTHSGDLVKNFAVKFSRVTNIPISHGLIKVRNTHEQKIFQNSYCKQENVAGAFDIDENIVKGKTIVLLDDIYDSGATLKEVGKILTRYGAKSIVPLVIAKTVGGTL